MIVEYFKHIVQLKFDEIPDYTLCYKLFKNSIEELGKKDEGVLEFEAVSKTYEIELELDISSDAEVNIIIRKTKI